MSTVIFEPSWDEHHASCDADDRERGPMLSLSLRIDPVSKALIRCIDGTPHPPDVQHAATVSKVICAAPDRGRTMPIPPTARLRRTCVRSQFGELPRLEWLMEQLIPRRSIGVIFGSSGVGKSAFVIDLGIAIASGRLWANRFDVVKGAVLICCQEGEEGSRRCIGSRWVLVGLVRERSLVMLSVHGPCRRFLTPKTEGTSGDLIAG